MKTVCELQKDDIQDDIDYWKDKYEACDEDSE